MSRAELLELQMTDALVSSSPKTRTPDSLTRITSVASFSTCAGDFDSDSDGLRCHDDEPRFKDQVSLPDLPPRPLPVQAAGSSASSSEHSFTFSPATAAAFSAKEAPNTTLMIRNIPHKYSQTDFANEVERLGLHGLYDFLHLPSAKKKNTRDNVGYAFINFMDSTSAEKAIEVFRSYRFSKAYTGKKIATASIAVIQGYDQNLKHSLAGSKKDDKQNRPWFLESALR